MKDNSRKNRKKNIIITFAVLCVVMIALLVLNSIDYDSIDVSSLLGDEAEETSDIFLYEPHYEIDITLDANYMSKDRYITYSDGTSSTIISEYSNEYGSLGQFFLDYFSCLVNGDAETYNSLFLDSYYTTCDAEPYEKFTMQRVYDISVELISEYLIEDESSELDGCTRLVYKVGYKIMHNDGTFRDDLPSDSVVPRLLEIVSQGDTWKITAISKLVRK